MGILLLSNKRVYHENDALHVQMSWRLDRTGSLWVGEFGVGGAVALRFAREGFAVALLSRSLALLEPIAREVRAVAAAGARVLVARCDVGNEESVAQSEPKRNDARDCQVADAEKRRNAGQAKIDRRPCDIIQIGLHQPLGFPFYSGTQHFSVAPSDPNRVLSSRDNAGYSRLPGNCRIGNRWTDCLLSFARVDQSTYPSRRSISKLPHAYGKSLDEVLQLNPQKSLTEDDLIAHHSA